jgi:hypothetical protein
MKRDQTVCQTWSCLIFLFLLLTGCGIKKNEKGNTIVTDTVANTQPITIVKEKTISDTTVTWVEEGLEKEEDEEDCVFNNDYKGLTTGWLKELKKSNFIWRNDLDQALIPKGQDTVFLSQGGCVHFGFLVELKLTNDNHILSDSVYWVHKALALATEYNMDHYQKMIQAGKIRKAQDGESAVWYEVDDDKPDDNLYYNGIEITFEATSKRISISQYFN